MHAAACMPPKVILISHLTKENGGKCRFYVYNGPVFVIVPPSYNNTLHNGPLKDNLYAEYSVCSQAYM